MDINSVIKTRVEMHIWLQWKYVYEENAKEKPVKMMICLQCVCAELVPLGNGHQFPKYNPSPYLIGGRGGDIQTMQLLVVVMVSP